MYILFGCVTKSRAKGLQGPLGWSLANCGGLLDISLVFIN